ncbi:MAG: L-threonylcarbamoyladenylate synthase [Chlorobi bacterium]|nr:L-threonylcarbamoyladenylate synthase [Chlorobiota bacterium]
METLHLNAHSQKDIHRAAELLRHGELIAIPTETVYGLAARYDDDTAIARIYRVKGRPQDNPLIVHCASVEDVIHVADNVPPVAWALLERFAPGPLTLILHRKQTVSPIVSAGLPTVAVRIPALDVARQLIAEVGVPLAAPSANRSGRPSPTCAEHVLADLGGKIAAVLDAGPCSIGIESTIVMVTDQIAVVRPGSITPQDLAEVLGSEPPVLTPDRPLAPGTKYRHYAPRIPVILIESVMQLPAGDEQNIVVLTTQRPTCNADIRPLDRRTLYEEFRRAEHEERTAIYVLVTDDVRADVALMNRLDKAATSSIKSSTR